MVKLSIVVPVYMVEKYIEKCIGSILENEFFDTNCELIVVDDGSRDESMCIVDSLCRELINVVIVRQENQGLGMARNAGVNKAKGEYIWFVDSDDWLPSDAISKVLSAIEKYAPDIVNINYVMSDGSRSDIESRALAGKVYTGLEYLDVSYVQNPVQYYVIARDFYERNKLSFARGLYHEDALFTPVALFLAERVVRLLDDCYIYNVREGSIMTGGNNLKHARDMLIIVRKLEEFRKINAVNNFQSRVFSKYISVAIGGIFYYWKKLAKADRSKISSEIDVASFIYSIWCSGSYKYLLVVALMKISLLRSSAK